MKILLAPAETKNKGGNGNAFSPDNFFLKELFSKREEVFNLYEENIKNLNEEELSSWFSLKKISEVQRYKKSLKEAKTLKAINRYNGVAFDALSYDTLDIKAQNYIDENVLLFSNLFGPIKANNPYYQ